MHLGDFRTRALILVGLGLLSAPLVAEAAPPWAQLIPFQRKAAPVKAAPVKTVAAATDYTLNENHGPWLILCTTFVGEAGEGQAQELAGELRSRYRLQAFVYRQHFDYTQSEVGLGFNRFGGAKKMRPMRPVEFDEHAVMVGNFESVNDPLLEKTLAQVKTLKPGIFSAAKQPGERSTMSALSQPLDRIRAYYRSIAPTDERKSKGPLSKAFVTRNPLLPDEYFVAKGLDPFLVEINKDLPYSLLRNPKPYTVKVATFRGVDTMKVKEFDTLVSKGASNPKIDQAAINASKLCAALREQGVEAYEFHDVSESIVTIGAFNSVGEERPDGKTEINPAVHRIMLEYAAQQQPIPGVAQLGIVPKKLAGISFDTQPIPVEVPRQSLAANYNSSNGALR